MKKILFATDFNHPALPMAVELARLKSSGLLEIIFLFVVDRDEVGFNVTTGFDAARAADLKASARSRFMEWQAVLEGEGVAASHLVEIGSPEGKILEAAHRVDADLIVVGREQETPLDDFYPWGVSMKIIRRSARPVLVYKYQGGGGAPANPFSKALFLTDFSEASNHALGFLPSLAETLERVDLVNVIAKSELENRESGADISEERRRKELLVLACEKLAGAKMQSSAHVLHGNPPEEILMLAVQLGYTLIICATTGKSGIREVLRGSVSHSLADRAPIPVLLIPSADVREEYA